MTQQAQAEVVIQSTSTDLLELVFPPNMRLHRSEVGSSWSVKREGTRFRTFSAAGLVLRDVLKELQKFIAHIEKVAGDDSTVRIRHQAGDNLIVQIVVVLTRICRKHEMCARYTNLCVEPARAQPRYAV